jgi:hypothetical protein
MDTRQYAFAAYESREVLLRAHFDVDSKQRKGRGAVKGQMKSECGEFALVDDAAFTRFIHRAGGCRGNCYDGRNSAL